MKKALVENNIKLVYYIAKRFDNIKGMDYVDRISAGNLGLLRAAEKFDPQKGVRFSTLACLCIKNAILQEARKIRISTISLDEPIVGDVDSLYYGDALGAADADIERIDNIGMLKTAIACLTSREKRIIQSLYGFNGHVCKTQKDIAKDLNISPAAVSRAVRKALKKMCFICKGL